jgi:hypothetical protein
MLSSTVLQITKGKKERRAPTPALRVASPAIVAGILCSQTPRGAWLTIRRKDLFPRAHKLYSWRLQKARMNSAFDVDARVARCQERWASKR